MVRSIKGFDTSLSFNMFYLKVLIQNTCTNIIGIRIHNINIIVTLGCVFRHPATHNARHRILQSPIHYM